MEAPVKIAGGLVGINEGTIANAYTNITFNTNCKASGFCYKNTGTIRQAFAKNAIKHDKKIAGFCSKNTGTLDTYFWLDKNQNKIKTSTNENLDIETLQNQHQWDFQTIWTTKGSNKLQDIQFKKEHFYETLSQQENTLVIKTAEELWSFAEKVNKGYDKYRNAHVILKANINLKGKNWIPIGTEEENAFCGTFDGNGHRIENFKIYQKKLNYVGFFGYIKHATIANVQLDCICKGNKYVGALVGINDKGTIQNCGVNTSLHIGEVTGGLVGKNTGTIHKCYAIGEVLYAIVLKPLIIKIAIILCILLVAGIMLSKFLAKEVYVPIAIDPNLVEDTQAGEEFTGNATDNKASFDFSQTIYIQKSNMVGQFDFRNPKRGNHDIVVKLYMDKEEIKQKTGKKDIGTQDEQIELYRSGLIKRGYTLPRIQLGNLPDGSQLPEGSYKATISLEFYKTDTNEKAVVNTNLPVDVVVR